jgi:hypothetical protein
LNHLIHGFLVLAYIVAVIRLVYPQAELSTVCFRPGTALVTLGFVLQEVGLGLHL